MFAVLPQEWSHINVQRTIVSFQIDERSPVKVILKPWNVTEEIKNASLEFQEPYLLVSGAIYEKHNFLVFQSGLGLLNLIPPKPSNFSELANEKWKKQRNIKNRTSAMNLKKQELRKSRNNKYCDAYTQTSIFGIVSNNNDQLSLSMIWSLLANCFTNRKRYDNNTYDISLLIYLSSAKTYNLLREILPLPSFQILYKKFGFEIKQEKKNMIDIEMIEKTIEEYKLQNHIDESTNFCNIVNLSIDAFAFKSFATTALTGYKNEKPEEKSQVTVYNNGFIFLMIPIDYRFPPKIMHIEKKPNGNYDDDIDEIAQYIINTLTVNNFRVWFKSTDGDPYLSQCHTNFYNVHVYGKSGNFLLLINNIYYELLNNSELTIPIGDPLHLFKNLRNRFQIYSIALFENSPYGTDYQKVKEILKFKKELEDSSKIGKMRDIYCLKMFDFENVIKLFISGDYIDAAFFFPFSCWKISIYSTKIDIQFRIFLIEICFQMLSIFHDNFPGLKKKGILQKPSEDSKMITIHEEQYLIRMMNTLIGTALTIIFTSDKIRMDGIGTHLVENAIGIARQCSSDPRWERIMSSFAHSELRKKIANKHKLRLHVQGRVNQGGCKVDEQNDSSIIEPLISKPDSWTVTRIIQLFIGLCDPETTDAFIDDLQEFINEMESLGNLVDIASYDINETANNGILARLISFKAKLEE